MRTIRHYVDQDAADHPDKVFMICPETGHKMTYRQLQICCRNLGNVLLAKGFEKGDKVSFMMGNGYQTARLFVGAMYAGFVIAPLNLQAQPVQIRYVLEHSDTKLIFTTELQTPRLLEAMKTVDREIEIKVIDKNAEHIFGSKRQAEQQFFELQELDPALLLYTSGTTGVPKGVILTHKNMIAGGQYVTEAHALDSEDRGLVSLPLFHINAEVVSVMGPLVSGSSVVMPERFKTNAFWPLMSTYRCTWFSVVPTMISYLVSATDLSDGDYHLDQVRFGRSASSALPPSLHKEFEVKFGISIVETMGLTETAAPVFSNPLDPSLRKYGSPGKAVGNQAKIIDDDGREVPNGTVGEIMIKGDNVMLEYYKAPEITAQTIEPDGWLHTGDLGYMDEDGFVFVTGRIKELIIKGGENSAPREIDEAAYQHSAVLDAAAVGIPCQRYGEDILLCVTLKPECTLNEKDLMDHCMEYLGKFKCPKHIVILEELPKGPSGKIQRLKLRELVDIERLEEETACSCEDKSTIS